LQLNKSITYNQDIKTTVILTNILLCITKWDNCIKEDVRY